MGFEGGLLGEPFDRKLCKFPKLNFVMRFHGCSLCRLGILSGTAFLNASLHLYYRVCLSVGPAVGPSVRRSVRPFIRRSARPTVRNAFVKSGEMKHLQRKKYEYNASPATVQLPFEEI